MRHLLNLTAYTVATGLGWWLGDLYFGETSPSWFTGGWTAGVMYLLVGWRK